MSYKDIINNFIRVQKAKGQEISDGNTKLLEDFLEEEKYFILRQTRQDSIIEDLKERFAEQLEHSLEMCNSILLNDFDRVCQEKLEEYSEEQWRTMASEVEEEVYGSEDFYFLYNQAIETTLNEAISLKENQNLQKQE